MDEVLGDIVVDHHVEEKRYLGGKWGFIYC